MSAPGDMTADASQRDGTAEADRSAQSVQPTQSAQLPEPDFLRGRRAPSQWRHWTLSVEGPVATLTLETDPQGGLFGGRHELKLNSYDLSVYCELAEAIRLIRFEHPAVGCVVITSGHPAAFCAGANIPSLAAADHAHKVNFCKFTNEVLLEIEEASARSGIAFLAAVNGACSGGGYELAMACDWIVLVDDRRTAVALPEVPLLGVLPGTGGLTRLTDKRHVRRDWADVFATRAEGVAGAEALAWGLVDELAKPTEFADAVRARAAALASARNGGAGAPSQRWGGASALLPGNRIETADDAVIGEFVVAALRRDERLAELAVRADPSPRWPLHAALELDAVLCHLRFHEPEIGTIALLTFGDAADARVHDRSLVDPRTHAERETALIWARALRRLDLMARSLIAVAIPGSCFAGVLAELALAADRTYLLDGVFADARPADAVGTAAARLVADRHPTPTAACTPTEHEPACLGLTATNLGVMPTTSRISRLRSRMWGDIKAAVRIERSIWTAPEGVRHDAASALRHGLATAAPDDIDFDDEVRVAVLERAAFSPDALTAMEANLRFCGPETMATKIFGRLSAWQNWVFVRPNSSGPAGALARYGSGLRPEFDARRT